MEPSSATDHQAQQSIMLSISIRSIITGTFCEGPRSLQLKFHGPFDMPLGRYLQDNLFNQTNSCRSCKRPTEAHMIYYTHQQGNLTINVRRIPSLKLAGEDDGKIWMWHRCLRCEQYTDEIPPATRRVGMSDADKELSFGKFLELEFSYYATANRVASCGHSLQRDCLQYYGFGSRVIFFQYSTAQIFTVCLPSLPLDFNVSGQSWLREAAAQLLNEVEALYAEISIVLHSIDQKISTTDISHLHNQLNNEQNYYHDMIKPAKKENSEWGDAEIDILELNRLKYSVLNGSHVWDRRISSLDTLLPRNSSFKIPRDEALRSVRKDWRNDICLNDSSSSNNAVNTESLENVPSATCALSDIMDSVWTGSGELPEKVQWHNLLPSATSLLSDGARLMVPQNSQNDIVIAVYENEPTSIIAYALSSKEYEDQIRDKRNGLEESWDASDVHIESSESSNVSAQKSHGSEDATTSIDPLSADQMASLHPGIYFEDDTPNPKGKVKFSVTCYFAKQFDALRKRCCPGELDFIRSLSRCKRWSVNWEKSNNYKSLDERFIIKQVKKTELESFERFAPAYFKYLTESHTSESTTCLAKVLGIYQVTVKNLKGDNKEIKMDLMVMENLFFKRKISRVYNVKGLLGSHYLSNTTGANEVLLETFHGEPIFLEFLPVRGSCGKSFQSWGE